MVHLMKRQLRVVRNYGSHDPMSIPGAVWIGREDTLPLWTVTPTAPAPAPIPLPVLAASEPEPEVQHNRHVIDYWAWRLDGLANGLTRRMRRS